MSEDALATVRDLDEREEMEPWIQGILCDTNRTPHGPSEIVDILTHKLVVRGREGLAAFILKGRSFGTVRPAHVSHQIFRLERLEGLRFAIFAATGNVLDEVKGQFVSTAKRLGCHYCILDAHDLARLFIAFGFICPRDGERLRSGRCSCGYSPANITSNLLQQEALREIATTHNLNQPAAAIILPTGAGKTRVAVLDVKRVGAQLCLYVAHSHEILESAENEFLREFAAEDIRRFEAAPAANEISRINLFTIQTLARNLAALDGRRVDYMIVDEFHHAAAASYRRAIETLAPKFLLGLTATPFRGDRQDVLALCNNNAVVCYELRQGIECGVLCPYHYFGCFDDIDYSNIHHNGQRYDINDLERALIIPERDAAIIAKWREKADGKATLAFCCSHLHADRVAESFRSKGIPAEIYLCSTDRDARAVLREKLRRGSLKVLCVVDVLNEGVDLPFVECLLFLRPTESKRVFFQQLGRGLRRFVGKEHCAVIDFIGNFQNAYRTVENLGLEPYEHGEAAPESAGSRSAKEILNLPAGCAVVFDERVIDIFGYQTLNPAFATRHNISRILIHQYRKVERRLGRRPTKLEIDRTSLLDSSLYELVFGSWAEFQRTLDR
ncbi:MAG: DEAD/DEAH box helicase family protein [Verrucomicrobiota bacterium]